MTDRERVSDPCPTRSCTVGVENLNTDGCYPGFSFDRAAIITVRRDAWTFQRSHTGGSDGAHLSTSNLDDSYPILSYIKHKQENVIEHGSPVEAPPASFGDPHDCLGCTRMCVCVASCVPCTVSIIVVGPRPLFQWSDQMR